MNKNCDAHAIGAYADTWLEAAPAPKGVLSRVRQRSRHAALSLLGRLSKGSRAPFLRPLYCHYVFADQKSRFRDVLRSLQTVGRFINTETCVRMLTGEVPIDGCYFHLSMDDGFRNVLDHAAPVLQELGIPAIFFVPSQFVGADWAKARQFCDCNGGYSKVVEFLKPGDLKTLRFLGFEIGSHTRTHARLSSITDKSTLETEVSGSKDELEQLLGERCQFISWPYGKRSDISEAALDCVRAAGYEACFGAFRGSVIPGTTERYSVPRPHFEVQWAFPHIHYFARGHMERPV